MNRVLLIVALIHFAIPAYSQLTRQEVLIRAERETSLWFSAYNPYFLNRNLFHPNYECSSDPQSSWVRRWAFDENGNPQIMSFWGNPYCLGGNDRMLNNDGTPNTNHQYYLYMGHGIGAHDWHHCSWPVDPWSVGIDCSEFIGQIADLGNDQNTTSLLSESFPILWQQLQPADIIINPGSHVRMFVEWQEFNQDYRAIEANGDTSQYDRVTYTYDNPVGETGYEARRLSIFGIPDAISDIGGFWLNYQDYMRLYFLYRINHTADPSDSAAVYVSDNPLGPAKLIRSSVRIPIINDPNTPEDELNSFSHAPFNCIDYYYYFLNHGPGPFSTILAPSKLYENSDNPILWYGQYADRPVLSEPQNVLISDVPLDEGDALIVQWDHSSADSTFIDCYNIYRRDSLSIASDFEYIGSVPYGSTSFTNTQLSLAKHYSFMVSVAHHAGQGGTPPQPEDILFGLWNDFSTPSDWVKPIHNFTEGNLTLIG